MVSTGPITLCRRLCLCRDTPGRSSTSSTRPTAPVFIPTPPRRVLPAVCEGLQPRRGLARPRTMKTVRAAGSSRSCIGYESPPITVAPDVEEVSGDDQRPMRRRSRPKARRDSLGLSYASEDNSSTRLYLMCPAPSHNITSGLSTGAVPSYGTPQREQPASVLYGDDDLTLQCYVLEPLGQLPSVSPAYRACNSGQPDRRRVQHIRGLRSSLPSPPDVAWENHSD